MPNYGDFNYWEHRYLLQQDSTFDWLEDFDSLKNVLEDVLINKENPLNNQNTLMLGCGNSQLTERLYKEMNFKRIFNIDISMNAIKGMREITKELDGLSWDVMDCRDLKFNQAFFDVVIDKCTMDTILCGDNPFLNVAMMTKEVQRVLKVSGLYIIVSHSDPGSRLQHLQREHLSFDIKVHMVKKDLEEVALNNYVQHHEQTHYVYVCKKKTGADALCQENFHQVYYDLEKENVLEEDEEVLMKTENQL